MSITTPVISEVAAGLLAVSLGQANLEALLAADVNDTVRDVIEINEGNSSFVAELGISDETLVADLVQRIEANLGSSDGVPDDIVDPSALVGGAPALNPELVGTLPPAGTDTDTATDVAGDRDEAGERDDDSDEDLADVADQNEDLQASDAAQDAEDVAPAELAVPEWVKNLSANGAMFKGQFDKYEDEFAPRRPVTQAQITRGHLYLLRTLCGIINTVDGDEFHQLFNYVLQRFNKGRTGVFREVAVHRGIDKHTMNPDQINLFPRLINMFIVLADPQSRAIGLRQVSISKTLQGPLLTDDGRRRVHQFFGQ